MDPRKAFIELNYEGKNITDDTAPDLKSFTYNDNASGTADDVSIELKDDRGKWISNWAPTKGDIIKPIIKTTDWNYVGDSQSLACGTFLVDDLGYSGRPRVLNIGAISAPSNSDFMTVEKSTTWQGATVQKIAQTIIDKTNKTIKGTQKLKLMFDSKANPIIDFVEQSKTPDVSFLLDICQKNGLAMKLHNNQIIMFNEQAYEAKKSVLTLAENDLTNWSAKTSFTDTGYDGCKTAYVNPNTGELLSYTFKAPGRTGNKIYVDNETLNSLAEAERYARCKLREINKKEYELSIEIIGNLKLVASQVITITDLGIFNGNYYIDKVSHTIGSGFSTALDIHKCLSGY
jgi:Phage protein D